MKTKILDFRIGRGIASFVLFMIAISNLVEPAKAVTTYHYSGSTPVVWTTNSTKLFTVIRTGTGALTVNGSIYGSSKFTLYTTNVYWPDSSHDTSGKVDSVRQFTVGFISSIHDTSYGTLYLQDSTRWDTITLIGIGPTSPTDTVDFNLYGGNTSYSVPDTVTSRGVLHNHHTTPITLRAVLTGDTGFTIDGVRSKTFSLAGSASDTFTTHYQSHHAGTAYAKLTFTSDSGHHQVTEAPMVAKDSASTPKFTDLVISTLDLGVVNDSACGTVRISNPNSIPIRINTIYFSSNEATWRETPPDTPYTLKPRDSVSFSVCWRLPVKFWSTSELTIILGYSDTSQKIFGGIVGYADAEAPPCFTVIPDSAVQMSDVMSGGWVEGTANIIMHTDSSLNLYREIGDTGIVTVISPTFPINVHSGDTVAVRFRYTPTIYGGHYSGFVQLTDGNCDPTFYLYGNAFTSTSDTLNLLSPQNVLLAMTTDSSVSSQTFYFRNPMAGNLFVNSVALAQGTHFSITGVSPHSTPPDDTLANGGLLAVTVRFNGDTSGFYHDSLIVNTENGLLASTFDLEAVAKLKPASGVSQTAIVSQVSMSLSPNPAGGLVSISVDQARQARIDIFDLLGNRLTSFDNIASHSWDPIGQPNGVYFVRASGTDAKGSEFTISKRLLLSR